MKKTRQHLLLPGTVIMLLSSCTPGSVRLDPGLVGQTFSAPQKDAVYVEKGTGLPAASAAVAAPPVSSNRFQSFFSQVQTQLEPHGTKASSGTGSVTLPSGTVQTPTAAYRTYTVLRGDTLSSIAARYGVRTGDLALANGLSANPNALRVGQVLRIPAPSVAAPQAVVQPAQTKPVPYTQQLPAAAAYVVQRGDTLSQIATRYGTTIEQLKILNGFTTAQANRLRVGQTIKLPRK